MEPSHTAAPAVTLTVSPKARSPSKRVAADRIPSRSATTRSCLGLPVGERQGAPRPLPAPVHAEGGCCPGRSSGRAQRLRRLAPGSAALWASGTGRRSSHLVHDRQGQRMAARSLECSGEAQHVVAAHPSTGRPLQAKACLRSMCRSCRRRRPSPSARLPSASASLMRMPWRAATPVPAMMAVGVEAEGAGQAMTNTATALMRPLPSHPPATAQPRKVARAIARTTGTNTALTRSTMRWIGALAAWADSTMRMMRASVVSAPTAVVRTINRPSALTEPPVTLSPTFLARGGFHR